MSKWSPRSLFFPILRPSSFILLLFLLLLVSFFAFAAGEKKVAVLELANRAGITDDEAYALTDQVRIAASQALPGGQFIVMTSENIEELLPPDIDLKQCTDAKCEVEMGRMLGADYIITGEIIRFGANLRINLRAHHCVSAHFVFGGNAEGSDVSALDKALADPSARMMASILKHATVTVAQPGGTTRSSGYDDLARHEQERADSERAARSTQATDYKKAIKDAFDQINDIRKSKSYNADVKKKMFREFLDDYPADNPYLDKVRGWLNTPELVTKTVKIPGGWFIIGCDDVVLYDGVDFDPESCRDLGASPPRHILVDAFNMDEHEVTVDQYRECVAAGVCPEPRSPKPEAEPYCNYGHGDRGAHPMNCIEWSSAKAYCAWVGKRLPTEAEWEKAAKGGFDNKAYPYGKAFTPSPEFIEERMKNDGSEAPVYLHAYGWIDCRYAIMASGSDFDELGELPVDSPLNGCGKMSTWPVMSLRDGRTVYGLHDVAGNVSEWCEDFFNPSWYEKMPDKNPLNTEPSLDAPEGHVIRGGSWRGQALSLMIPNRSWAAFPQISVGFRCVISDR